MCLQSDRSCAVCDRWTQVAQDVYDCSYEPRHAGCLSISVLYAGQPVAQSPYPVHVGPMSWCRMRAFGPGLETAVAGFPATFTVQTNDQPGTLRTCIQGGPKK